MEHVASLLGKVLARRGISDHAEAALVTHRASLWIKKALPEVAEHLRPVSLSDGELTIQSSHTIASQEMNASCGALLESLRAAGHQNVTRVRVIHSQS